jgi:signal transduction histidine kinase
MRASSRIPLEMSIVRHAIADGLPVVMSIDDYPDNELKRAAAGSGIRLLVSIPVMAKGQPLGAITLASLSDRTVGPEERALLANIGRQIGVAVENARLYEGAEEAAASAERSRLARELHDAVTQTLFSASLIAEVRPRLWERSPDEGRRRLSELRQLTRGALAEMRTLLLELRPSALADIPLPDLLRQLADSTIGRARVLVTVSVEGEPITLAPDAKIVLYRIAQESLNNIAKHSGASAATVSLHYLSEADGTGPDGVELSIRDNGDGFDPAAVTAEHLGLRIMRERAEAIGATFTIRSQPGVGTETSVIWQPR